MSRICTLQKIFLLATVYVFSVNLKAQNSAQLIIHVFNEKEEPVAGALISIEDEKENGVGFYYTNENGSTEIDNLQADAFFIKVSGVGYIPSRQQIITGKNVYTFILKEQLVVLDSVLIHDKQRPKMVSRADTTIFRVKDFISPADKTLEDVLRRLPGVDINNEGVISFKGRNIGQLTIEGDNLLDSRYKLATTVLPPDAVDSIQFIENNQRKKVLQGRESGKDTDLNITLNEKSKLLFLHFVNAGLGLPSNLLADLSSLAFMARLKTINKIQWNNRGEDVTEDILKTMTIPYTEWQQFQLSAQMISAASLPKPTLPRNRWLDNKSFAVTGNALYKLTSDHALKVNASYGNQREQNSYQQNKIWITGKDTAMTIENNILHGSKRPLVFNLSTTTNKKSKFIENKTAALVEENNQNINLNAGSIGNQEYINNKVHLLNYFSAIFLFKKRLLPRFVSSTEYISNNENLNIHPGIFQNILNNSKDYDKAIQHALSKGFYTSNSLGLTFLKKKISQSYHVGFNLNLEQVSTDLTLQDAEPITTPNGYNNKGNLRKFEPFLFSKWQLNTTKINLSADLLITWPIRKYTDQDNNLPLKKSEIQFSPGLRYEQRIGKENQLRVYGSLTHYNNTVQDIYRGVYLQNYQTLYSSSVPFLTRREKRISTEFNFQKSLKLLLSGVKLSYSSRNQDWIESYEIRENRLVLNTLYHPNTNNQASFNFWISKYEFVTGLTFSGIINSSITKGIYYQNESFLERNLFKNSYQFKLQKRIGHALELGYDINLQEFKSKDQNAESAQQSVRNLYQNGYLKITSGRWLISGNVNHTQFLKTNQSFVFIDTEFRYKLEKSGIELSLQIQNLTNISNYIQQMLEPSFEMYSEISLRPRSIFLSAGFNF